MKNLFVLVTLGFAPFLAANQYQSYDNQNADRYYQRNSRSYYNDRDQDGYYQGQNSQDNYGFNDDQQEYANPSQKAVSDQEINKKISDKLGSGWFSKGYEGVRYTVRNGVVTLTGTVNSIADRNKVDDEVKKIDGVRQINSEIRVVNPNTNTADRDTTAEKVSNKYPQDSAATAADNQINGKIRSKLNEGWFSKGNDTLVLKTVNGVVTITGVVDKPEDGQKINEQIQNIDGVKRINNQLSVKNS